MGAESSPNSRSEEPPELEAASASLESEGKPKQVTSLSRDLADFLIEFSIVLHKRSMYPAGHPHLRTGAERFARRLNALLENRASVTLGVARNRLVIETATTDPKNALLRDLAQRLHRHRIAAVHLTCGATSDEIEQVLAALSANPQYGDGPLGKRLDRVGPWTHIGLRPVGFDKLVLQDPGASAEPRGDRPADGRDAWVELARLALTNGPDNDSPTAADPLVVAQAIGRKSGEVAYDRVVLGYLSRVAEEMSGRQGVVDDQLGERISSLIQALDPNTLHRLLETGADQAERRRFALNASQVLAADAVIEVLEAAAKASHQTISHNLLNLLHKLAHHAEEGAPETRAEAEGALRSNVARLIGDWELEDPNPKAYTAILEGMVRTAPDDPTEEVQSGCEPEIIVRMALELDCIGPSVFTAAEGLLNRRQFGLMAGLLEAAPQTETTMALWRYVASPERLDAELVQNPPDQEVIEILIRRLGMDAANSLLDHLGRTDDRSTRAALMKHLLALGPGIGEVAVARLRDAPWYLQRNILVLIGRLKSWPQAFSPLSYAAHADPRIRREGIKLLLESREHLIEGILLGLRDQDEGIVGLALRAALESCPADAIPLLEGIALDSRRPAETKVPALRILARTRSPVALAVLLALAQHRRRWFGRRLPSKSPELLAAVAGLAGYWADHPMANEVLSDARKHADPDIRAAAGSTP
ncbi:MAG: hypothetical protein QOH59_186 [Gemmatimonadales bacterium]|nr:hypothetical protein [Gemmatimonadales bacterium]